VRLRLLLALLVSLLALPLVRMNLRQVVLRRYWKETTI
jgi:hypothetical protein